MPRTLPRAKRHDFGHGLWAMWLPVANAYGLFWMTTGWLGNYSTAEELMWRVRELLPNEQEG